MSQSIASDESDTTAKVISKGRTSRNSAPTDIYHPRVGDEVVMNGGVTGVVEKVFVMDGRLVAQLESYSRLCVASELVKVGPYRQPNEQQGSTIAMHGGDAHRQPVGGDAHRQPVACCVPKEQQGPTIAMHGGDSSSDSDSVYSEKSERTLNLYKTAWNGIGMPPLVAGIQRALSCREDNGAPFPDATKVIESDNKVAAHVWRTTTTAPVAKAVRFSDTVPASHNTAIRMDTGAGTDTDTPDPNFVTPVTHLGKRKVPAPPIKPQSTLDRTPYLDPGWGLAGALMLGPQDAAPIALDTGVHTDGHPITICQQGEIGLHLSLTHLFTRVTSNRQQIHNYKAVSGTMAYFSTLYVHGVQKEANVLRIGEIGGTLLNALNTLLSAYTNDIQARAPMYAFMTVPASSMSLDCGHPHVTSKGPVSTHKGDCNLCLSFPCLPTKAGHYDLYHLRAQAPELVAVAEPRTVSMAPFLEGSSASAVRVMAEVHFDKPHVFINETLATAWVKKQSHKPLQMVAGHGSVPSKSVAISTSATMHLIKVSVRKQRNDEAYEIAAKIKDPGQTGLAPTLQEVIAQQNCCPTKAFMLDRRCSGLVTASMTDHQWSNVSNLNICPIANFVVVMLEQRHTAPSGHVVSR